MQKSTTLVHGEFTLIEQQPDYNGGLDYKLDNQIDINEQCINMINSITSWLKSKCMSSSNYTKESDLKHILNILYIIIINECPHILVFNMLLNNEIKESKTLSTIINDSLDLYVQKYASLTMMILVILQLKIKSNNDNQFKLAYENIYKILYNKFLK